MQGPVVQGLQQGLRQIAETTSAAVSKAMAKSKVLWLQRAAVANMSKSPNFSARQVRTKLRYLS
jgi:hypothetical protein